MNLTGFAVRSYSGATMDYLILFVGIVIALLIAFGRYRLRDPLPDPELEEYESMKPELDELLAESKQTLQPNRLPLP